MDALCYFRLCPWWTGHLYLKAEVKAYDDKPREREAPRRYA